MKSTVHALELLMRGNTHPFCVVFHPEKKRVVLKTTHNPTAAKLVEFAIKHEYEFHAAGDGWTFVNVPL